jgi:cobyrinic acid a,c-diamide synthase
VTADSRNLPPETLEALADAFEHYSALSEIVNMARSSPFLYVEAPGRKGLAERMHLGVACDAAFHFYYRDLFDELEDSGCRIVRFSPVADRNLPEGLDALYLGGGYPEEMAAELSANGPMLASVRDFAASGRPVYAECGGLMYLCKDLEAVDGKRYPMAGLLPAATKMHAGLQALSYVNVTLKEDSLWGLAGDSVRGHEFHHSTLTASPAGTEGWRCVYSMKKRWLDAPVEEGFQKGNLLASYTHLHLPSRPGTLEHFVQFCEKKENDKTVCSFDNRDA